MIFNPILFLSEQDRADRHRRGSRRRDRRVAGSTTIPCVKQDRGGRLALCLFTSPWPLWLSYGDLAL